LTPPGDNIAQGLLLRAGGQNPDSIQPLQQVDNARRAGELSGRAVGQLQVKISVQVGIQLL
jgi:hypothetical protein